MSPSQEVSLRAPCFGGEVAVHVSGPNAFSLAHDALEELHRIDRALSRFRPDSELCRVNADPGTEVAATALMLDLAEAVGWAGELSGGLVDGTLLDPIEDAGYVDSFDASNHRDQPEPPVGRRLAALPGSGWRSVDVHRPTGTIRRPPGVRIDSGGLGKGLAADRVGALLSDRPSFCVDCGGDMLIGGVSVAPRTVSVEHPISGDPAAQLQVTAGGVATSGVARRAWRGEDGSSRHHLIDPGRGVPAFTGVLQVTALAPTALEAEVLAKAALLSGPSRAADWLRHGGVVVAESGEPESVPPPKPLNAPQRVA
jgi:thiamine biosynthesis lipoprotein